MKQRGFFDQFAASQQIEIIQALAAFIQPCENLFRTLSFGDCFPHKVEHEIRKSQTQRFNIAEECCITERVLDQKRQADAT